MQYQNLAYCRFLHIWATFYFFNLISLSPLFSFYITFLFHYINLFLSYSSKSKILGLFLSDLILLFFLNYYSSELNIWHSILMFVFYNLLLEIYNFLYNDNINIVSLHCEKLREDDLLHKDENYFNYIIRVWSYMFDNITNLSKLF